MTNIDFSQMVHQLAKDGDVIAKEISGIDAHLIHMSVGVMGEVGELIAAVNNNDRANQVEELGDLEFYLEGLRQGMEIDREKTIGLQVDNLLDASSPFSVSDRLVISTADLLDTIKKSVIYRKPLKKDVVIECLSWVERYIGVMYLVLGICRNEAITANIEKLGVRYKGFTYGDEQAQTRADKKDGE
ncbi:MazG-like pyrophosphatase [Thiohalocapsa phage LS06-2018-MD03]|nr:MazG-like pyrophosphatase [Thiohalocapsa phage LS06-2018-MD03]